MSQDDYIAKQDRAVSSITSLLTGLRRLSLLHMDINQQSINKWQEDNITPITHDCLKIPTWEDWQEYFTDLPQRTILFWDTLRQRGDNTLTYQAEDRPLLLKFDYDVLIDGKDLDDPCNYSLLEIKPAAGQIINEKLQPIVVVDPRGGHGAGIGGFKEDSEIGESLRAGHPTYFISFSYSPVQGQTLETITKAQAIYIEEVIKRHPKHDKPIIIGNCQAGWAIMLLASERPELPGGIIINGAPLAYWSGVTGRNPMRYAGGLMGGAWATRLASDLGNGRFDGTWLVSNFENLNPANTFWGKYYNLFSKIDTEPSRFLDFERWWGNPVLYNSEEIEAIVDELFIGNRLTNAGLGGQNKLFRNIESPIIVFCSSGDNITPPQQALNWIIDVYPNDIDLKKAGKTIIYLQHKNIGHLGIFVSGTVARREHRQLIASLDAVKALPPGLFEMIIKDVKDEQGNIVDHQVFFEVRSIQDLQTGDSDGREDEKVFSLVSRISETNSNLYEWLIRPVMRHFISEPTAQFLRDSNPFHVGQVAWSSVNPLTWWLPGATELVKHNRRPVAKDNPIITWQEIFSKNVVNMFDAYRDLRDSTHEMCFYSIYGVLNALTNSQANYLEQSTVNQSRELTHRLENTLTQGNTQDATIRILLLLASEAGIVNRDFLAGFVQHYRETSNFNPLTDRKALREIINLQSLLVFTQPKESLNTLTNLLPTMEIRKRILEAVAVAEPALIETNAQTKALWLKINDILLGEDAKPVASIDKVKPAKPAATQPTNTQPTKEATKPTKQLETSTTSDKTKATVTQKPIANAISEIVHSGEPQQTVAEITATVSSKAKSKASKGSKSKAIDSTTKPTKPTNKK